MGTVYFKIRLHIFILVTSVCLHEGHKTSRKIFALQEVKQRASIIKRRNVPEFWHIVTLYGMDYVFPVE